MITPGQIAWEWGDSLLGLDRLDLITYLLDKTRQNQLLEKQYSLTACSNQVRA